SGMSVAYIPVQWNRAKWIYDAVLALCVLLYVWAFIALGAPASGATRPMDGAILNARALGTCAFFMMSLVLMIGPLARLDRRFLPLLYNRRHFGVMTAFVALGHAAFVLGWYFAFSPTPPLEALLTANTTTDRLIGFPFEWLGAFALIVLGVLAATSHDFWLNFLGAPMWKALHLAIYPAYVAVTGHIALGALQSQTHPAFAMLAVTAAGGVAVLHLLTWRDAAAAAEPRDWIAVPMPEAIPEGRARVVTMPDGTRAAVFRHEGTFAAISHACAHQNGPLGEGRILFGCVTCPWHGFQYRLEDGRSPPPFTETVPTFDLRRGDDGRLEISTRPNPPGTPTTPIPAEGLA
ncbi:MAG: ferric reductase-like transmembrane domain-containing protein, partial [Pseudomonadota bacterium]